MYRKIRPALFTLALGLASVWLHSGWVISSDHVAIELPKASTEVLLVTLKNRYSGLGGGSGPHGPSVSLELKRRSSDHLTFRLANLTAKPVYIVHLPSTTGGSVQTVPYFMECWGGERVGQISVVSTTLDGVFELRKLEPEISLEFTISAPQKFSNCSVYVSYAEDFADANLLLRQSAHLAKDWYEFEKKSSRWTCEVFSLKAE